MKVTVCGQLLLKIKLSVSLQESADHIYIFIYSMLNQGEKGKDHLYIACSIKGKKGKGLPVQVTASETPCHPHQRI